MEGAILISDGNTDDKPIKSIETNSSFLKYPDFDQNYDCDEPEKIQKSNFKC